MEFDKSKVYTVLNADDIKVGTKGYFADTISQLKKLVEQHYEGYGEVDEIFPDSSNCRFSNKDDTKYALFYKIAEPKEKKFRPYKDTDEMIEDFKKRYNSYGGWSGKDNPMYNPMIWVKAKGVEKNKYLITRFQENERVTMDFNEDIFTTGLCTLLDNFTYLDGTPCGIMEE